MKSLTQKEILSWNKRIISIISINSNYTINKLNFNYKTNYGRNNAVIIRTYDDNNMSNSSSIKIIKEAYIEYDFCFSVVKNHNEDFFNLLNKIFKNELFFEYYVDEYSTKKLVLDKSVLFFVKEMNYTISDREFTRYQYNFKGDIFSIMAYISYLEEAIDCFNLLYGYDENGKEINLLKFPIGTIVTIENDTDKDYLVIDYNFNKKGDDIYITYVVTEILYNNKPIIKYGEVSEFYEKNLCISRNGRIDKILN